MSMLALLPFYFALGGLLYFGSSRWAPADHSFQRVARFAGGLLISLVVLRLFGFLASSGEFAFAVPAIVIGAMGAATFADSRRRRPMVPNSRDRALFVAAAALLQILVALDFEYRLFHNLTKFSAASVSVEFGQGTKSQEGTPLGNAYPSQQSGVVAAFRRTQGILYATRQLALFGDLMKQDRTFAEMSSGFAQSDDQSADLPTDELQQFACRDLFETARKLLVVQKSYKSEFPTLGILPSVSLKLRQLYEMDYRVMSSTTGSNSPDAVVLVTNRNDLLDRIHGDYDDLKKAVSDIYELMSPKQRDDSSLDLSHDYCETLLPGFARFPIVRVTTDVDNTRSVYLGYLAALAAFAEFVDGNRESAIQLLDDRVSREISSIDALSKGGAYPSAATDRFEIAQKEALVLRLIRWEANLIKFASSPQDALDTFAAKQRYRDYVDIVTRALRFRDKDGAIARRIVDPKAACPVDALGDLATLHEKITPAMQRKIYFTLLYYKFTYHNNLISVAGANRQVAVDDDRVDLKLVADLDQWADELPNVDLSCLKDAAGVKVDATARSFFWESIGSYRESKGRNFFLPDSRGPVGENCRAIAAYRRAKSAYEDTPVEDGSTELEAALSHQDDANYRQRLNDKICAIKGWMKQVYAEGELDREPACAEALAADVCPGAP
ncbi:MAG: hypothetical protein ABR970_13510 [Roseiarcus sp.]